MEPIRLWPCGSLTGATRALIGDCSGATACATKAEVGNPADHGGVGSSQSSLGGRTVRAPASVGSSCDVVHWWAHSGQCRCGIAAGGHAASTLGGRTVGGGAASSLGGFTRRSSKRALSRVFADALEAGDEDSTPVGPSKHALCQRRFRFRENVLVAGGRQPTFECPQRDYVYTNESRSIVSNARRAHLKRWHHGQGLPGPIRASTDAFRKLSQAEVRDDAFDWRCPERRFGLPSQARSLVSKHAFERATAAHRRKCHASFSDREWQANAAAQAQRRRWARRTRVIKAANHRATKLCTGDAVDQFTGYNSLLWPIITANLERPTRVVWRVAWACVKCGHLYTHRREASLKKHRCCKFPSKKGAHEARRRRYWQAVNLLRRSVRGLPENVLSTMLAAAEAVRRRSDSLCRRCPSKSS